MPPQTLKSAVELAKAGKKEEARYILERILEHDANNELAFFWYLDTLPGNKERITALEDFLSKHPRHERAQIALDALRDLMKKKGGNAAVAQPRDDVVDGVVETLGEVVQEIESASPQVLTAAGVDTVALKQRERERARLQKEKKPARTGLKAAIILFLLLAIAASYFVPMLLNSSALMTKEQRYAHDMLPVIVLINEYMHGPVAEWSEAVSEPVYEGNDSTYRELLYYNMRMGYSDVLVSRKLTPIARQISVDGTEIMTALAAIEAPQEIMEDHVEMAMCVKYEIEWAVALTDFLVNSQARELPESPCATFSASFKSVEAYVEEHQ